jgi:hypothetical protein
MKLLSFHFTRFSIQRCPSLGLLGSVLLAAKILGVCIAAFATNAQAQDVSLITDDTIDDVPVTIGGINTTITTIRDANNPKQWYYVPKSPRLVEIDVEGKHKPVFHLYRTQFADPSNPGKLIEKGLLQFALTFAVPTEAQTQLRDAIATKTKIPKELISLSALRIKSSQVNVWVPEGNDFIAAPISGNGIAPLFSTQEMAFAIPLTRQGAALYDALAKGTDGVKVQISFTYGGLTSPAGFTVTVDYAQAFKHYSENTKFRAEASYYGLFGASYEKQTQTIREELENSGAMKVDIKLGEGVTMETVDKYLQPIVKRINDQVLETFRPPDKIDPAVAPGNNKGGYFGSVNYSASVKDISQVKQIKDKIDFSIRQYEERTTNAAGFISVASYSDEIRNSLFTVVPNQNWESAFFILPTVGDDPSLAMSSVDLSVTIGDQQKSLPQKTTIWTPNGGWKDPHLNLPVAVVSFPLLGEGFTPDRLRAATCKMNWQINSGNQVLKIEQSIKAFDGDLPVVTPTSAVSVVEIDGNDLSWRKMGQSSTLDRVLVTLRHNGRSKSGVLVPRSVNGAWALPAPIRWLIDNTGDAAAAPVDVNLQFELSDGSLLLWTGNGDLRKRYPGLSVALKDAFVPKP